MQQFPIWLATALLLGVAWLHTFDSLDEDRAEVTASAGNELVNLARLSQEHAERTFYSADQTLRMVLGQYREHQGKIDLKAILEQGVIDTRILMEVNVIDARGILEQSSLPFSGRIDLSEREHFKVHVAPDSDAPFISRPVPGPVSGKWSIQVSRRISGKNGEFGGVAVASLDPAYFTRFYGELKLGQQGDAALVGLDRAVRAQRGGDPEEFGDDLSASPVFLRLAQGDQTGTFTSQSAHDGVERIQHFMKLPSYPLLVTIGMASKEVFSNHEQMAVQHLWQVAIISFLVVVLAAVTSWYGAARRHHSQTQAQALMRLQDLTSRVPGLVFQYLRRPDGSSCFPFASEGIRDIYRLRPDEVAQDASRAFSLIHPDDAAVVAASIEASARTLTPWEHEFRVRFEDGTVHWHSCRATPQQQDDGSVLWHGFVFDVSERKRADAQLRIAATAFESQEGMCITDARGVILSVNQAYSRITGYPAEEAIGKTPSLLSSGRHDAAFYAAMWSSLGQNGTWQGEIWNRRKSGEVFPEWLTITTVKDEQEAVTHYVSTLTDITQRKAAEDQIMHLAFYDPLTGLPNRRLLIDRLGQALATSTRSGREAALLFMDLDNFKTLNDTHGHGQGDILLQQVGQRLVACVREGDTVARLGGDEFAIMLEDLSTRPREAASQAEAIGEKILSTLNLPFDLAGNEYHITLSLGVTLFVDHQNSTEELMKRADLAVNQAKAAGGNTLRFFDPEMQAAVNARVALERDLRCGLQENQFLLHYQPQVDEQGRLTGVEALLRWQHPQRGMVWPAHFIPLAEDAGLILPLGHWVLQTACLQLKAWAGQPHTSHLTLSVNVSALQFHLENFAPEVLAMIARTGAPAARLKLELTESLLVKDVDAIIVKMLELKAHGVGFSLDDFGTGYSSLSYLKRLPLDQLKIDQSFLHEALTNPNDAAIVRAIVTLGQSLGMMVIAEGVETQAQRDFLVRQGCLNFQGYYFGGPAPVAALERFLHRG